jgi:hypothetical protein
MEKLYVNFTKPPTLKEFFIKFFQGGDEYLGDRIVSGKQTYYDKACTNLQCGSYTNRSFSDLLNLAKTYYKTATHKKVLITLINLKLVNLHSEPCYFYLLSCIDINKDVVIYYRCKCTGYISNEIRSDGFSKQTILDPVGVKTDLKEIYETKYYNHV